MVPTVLDLLGMEPPAAIRGVTQAPIQGVSFAHALDDPAAPSRHHTQYFEMLGHRAIYKDGWRAVCPWPGPSFAEAGTGFGNPISAEKLTELDATGWELYHIDEDPAENHNLAADHRAKLIELIGTWYVEAGKYGVMPVDGSGLQRMVAEKPLVSPAAQPVRLPPGHPVHPQLRRAAPVQPPAQHHRDRRDPGGRRRGRPVLPGHGGRRVLAVRQGRPAPLRPQLRRPGAVRRVSSPDPLPAGRHELRFEFEPTGQPDMPHGKGVPARLQLYVDGALVASADAPYTTPFMFNPGGVSCGHNPGSPVTPDYTSPFKFTGTLETVVVDVSGELIVDPEAELRAHMARQ